MSAAHTDKIILSFCEYKNHSKENTATIICEILNHSLGNFVIEIKKISSCFSKISIQIQSWSEKSQVSCRTSNPDPVHARLWCTCKANVSHLDENVAALWVWLNSSKSDEPMHSAQAQSVRVTEKISFLFVGNHCRDISRSEDICIFCPYFRVKSLRFEL